ncbi:MAG: ABC transporter permease [Candidatus Helarchaeota archaeon]
MSEKSRRRLFALIRKELGSLIRDKQALLVVFILPIIVIVAIGLPSGGNGDNGTPLLIGIIDLDSSEGDPDFDLSQNWTMVLDSLENVDIVNLTSISEAENLTRLGIINGFVVIPYGFEQNLSEALPTYLDVYYDSVDATMAVQVVETVKAASTKFKFESGTYWLTEIVCSPEDVPVYGSDTDIFHSAPSTVTIVIFATVLMLASQSIVQDVALARMLLTPARKTEVIFAKLVAYLFIGALQILFILSIAYFGFGMPINGNVFLLFFLLFLLAYTAITLGLIISSISTSRLQASQYFVLTFVSILIVTWFVSGTTRDYIPLYIAKVGFTELAYRGLFSFTPYYTNLLIFGTVCLLIALIIFHIRKTTV